MSDSHPHVVLQLGLNCKELTGRELTGYLSKAVPFYRNVGDVDVRLLRSLDKPGHFVEIIEYATEEAFQADQDRMAHDKQMQDLLAEWRGLLVDPPQVEHFADITPEIEEGAPHVRQ